MDKRMLLLTLFLYAYILSMNTHKAVVNIPSPQVNEYNSSQNRSYQSGYNQSICGTPSNYHLTEGAIQVAKYGVATDFLIGRCTMTGYLITSKINLTNVYPIVLGSLLSGTALGTITGMLLGLFIGTICSAH